VRPATLPPRSPALAERGARARPSSGRASCRCPRRVPPAPRGG
jgi:hypothetical protein